MQRDYFGDLSREGERENVVLPTLSVTASQKEESFISRFAPCVALPVRPRRQEAARGGGGYLLPGSGGGGGNGERGLGRRRRRSLAWIGRRYSGTLIRRCKKPRLPSQDPSGLLAPDVTSTYDPNIDNFKTYLTNTWSQPRPFPCRQ